jgi:hypothetical protein
MTRFRRLRYAYRHIRTMAQEYSHRFERTISWRIADTYGLRLPNGQPDAEIVKRIKAKHRCELSCGEMGK